MCLDSRAMRSLAAHKGWVTRRARAAGTGEAPQPFRGVGYVKIKSRAREDFGVGAVPKTTAREARS